MHRTFKALPDGTHMCPVALWWDATALNGGMWRKTCAMGLASPVFPHKTMRKKEAKRLICQKPAFPAAKSGTKKAAAKVGARVHYHTAVWQLLASIRKNQQPGAV